MFAEKKRKNLRDYFFAAPCVMPVMSVCQTTLAPSVLHDHRHNYGVRILGPQDSLKLPGKGNGVDPLRMVWTHS